MTCRAPKGIDALNRIPKFVLWLHLDCTKVLTRGRAEPPCSDRNHTTKMPSYLGDAIQISLSHAELKGTLTQKPLKRVGKETREVLETIDTAFKNGNRLKELPFPSDDGLSLRYLGESHDHMPFYMIKAGQSLYQRPITLGKIPEGSSFARSKSLTKSASSTQKTNSCSLERRALCLTVGLNAGSFLPQPSCTTLPGRKSTLQDIKVDVFFNGERCACTFTPARSLPSNGQFKSLETYHGKRTALAVEQPWIIVPADQSPDGDVRADKHPKLGNPDQRWAAVNNLLLSEAEDSAKDEHGHLTVLGDYLYALATVKLPEDLQRLQSVNYGVLDVILISGQGKKDDASEKYLTRPVSARLSRLDWDMLSAMTQYGVKSRKAATLTTLKNDPSYKPSNIGVTKSRSKVAGSHNIKTPAPGRTKRKKPAGQGTTVLPVPFTPMSTQGRLATSMSTPDSARMLDSPLVAKRRRIMEATNCLSLPLRAAASDRFIRQSGTIQNGSPVHSQPIRTHGSAPPSRISVFRLPPEHLQRYSIPVRPVSQPIWGATQGHKLQTPQGRVATTVNTPRKTVPSSASDSITVAAPPIKNPLLSASQINEDCVITYDPNGLRQVRKERTGSFQESGVILGVRYIILPT